MIIKLFRENNPEAPFATKSDIEAVFEKIAEAAGSEQWWDIEQVAADVAEMRKTILIARTLLLHEDLNTALFLAHKISDEQFELSAGFRQLVQKFNEGTKRILQGERKNGHANQNQS